ncbi:MAG: hypothetical protein ABI876_07380 [Bacteroidota bacterium]
MNFGFTIELELDGPKGTIYTVKIDGELASEFDKAHEALKHLKDFQRVMRQLENMVDRHGFQEPAFRQEGTARDSVAALSKESGKVRIYCCRWSTRTLLLGCGCLKDVARVQDDKTLTHYMETMMYVDRRLMERIRDRSIEIGHNGELIGILYFPPEEI